MNINGYHMSCIWQQLKNGFFLPSGWCQRHLISVASCLWRGDVYSWILWCVLLDMYISLTLYAIYVRGEEGMKTSMNVCTSNRTMLHFLVFGLRSLVYSVWFRLSSLKCHFEHWNKWDIWNEWGHYNEFTKNENS